MRSTLSKKSYSKGTVMLTGWSLVTRSHRGRKSRRPFASKAYIGAEAKSKGIRINIIEKQVGADGQTNAGKMGKSKLFFVIKF